MSLFSTEPGVQFYSAAPLNCPAPGLDGQHYGAHAGLALEPQAFPDSPNRRHFTNCVLRPEDEYRQVSEFRFAVAGASKEILSSELQCGLARSDRLAMLSAAQEDALNRPVWSALTTGDRQFAQGGPLALRFPPDIAPFGATADNSPEAFAALCALIPQDGRVALVTVDKLKPFPGLEIVREAPILQMVADGETPARSKGSGAHRAWRKRRPRDAASCGADPARPVWSAHA